MSSSPVGWAQRTQRSISDAIGYLLLYSLSRLTQCAIETTTCPRNNMRKERCMPAYCVAYQSSHSKNHIVKQSSTSAVTFVASCDFGAAYRCHNLLSMKMTCIQKVMGHDV